MTLATADLPDGLATYPLTFDSKYFVYDDAGRLCGVASYRRWYYHEKLNGASPVKAMSTYYQDRDNWPQVFRDLRDAEAVAPAS